MKSVYLTRLRLQNFAGVRDFSAEFTRAGANIYGTNETGKSTLNNAFTWLLFGKDQFWRDDYGIKTLDKNNQPIHGLQHEVEGVFMVDGRREVLRRVYQEKWQTKRGSTTPEFTGHETLFYWNDVPLKAKEYAEKVSNIINEDLFKLITNPAFFNSLHWEKRRSVLLEIAGTISTQDVIKSISTANDLQELIDVLNSGKTLVEWRKELSAKRKKLKDEVEMIPVRINEAKRNMPEQQNWSALEAELKQLHEDIAEVDRLREDILLAQRKRHEKIHQLNEEKNRLLTEYNARVHELRMHLESQQQNRSGNFTKQKNLVELLRSNLKSTEHEISQRENQIKINNDTLAQRSLKLNQLREKWAEVNAEAYTAQTFVVDYSAECCPFCQQPLPEDQKQNKIEKLESEFNKAEEKRLKEFNEDKLNRLSKLEREAESVKAEIESLQTKNGLILGEIERLRAQVPATLTEITEQQQKLDQLEYELENEVQIDVEAALHEMVLTDEKAQGIRASGYAIKKSIAEEEANTEKDVNDEGIRVKREELQQRVYTVNKLLALKDVVDETQKRIVELENREQILIDEIAGIEKHEFDADAFERTKMDMVEKRVNTKFQYVSFKLFERQINGGEVPACECLIKGVPYAMANTASRVNAGVDIINALCEHFNVTAPIFIDNRESTVSLLPTKSQIINLIVKDDEPALRVVNVEDEAQVPAPEIVDKKNQAPPTMLFDF